MLTLWHSLTSGRHACKDVWNCWDLEPRLRCSHNLLSDQNTVISSGWWPSLVLLMFWTDFLSFGEMFDLVYFNYCPSFLFFPISLERCKTKEIKKKKIKISILTGRVANWFLERHDISCDGCYERNNDGKASSEVVVFPIQRIVNDQME